MFSTFCAMGDGGVIPDEYAEMVQVSEASYVWQTSIPSALVAYNAEFLKEVIEEVGFENINSPPGFQAECTFKKKTRR